MTGNPDMQSRLLALEREIHGNGQPGLSERMTRVEAVAERISEAQERHRTDMARHIAATNEYRKAREKEEAARAAKEQQRRGFWRGVYAIIGLIASIMTALGAVWANRIGGLLRNLVEGLP